VLLAPRFLNCAIPFSPLLLSCATEFTPHFIISRYATPLSLTNPTGYQVLYSLYSLGMMFGLSKGRSSKQMRSFLINKNLCLCYWLRKRIGKKRALRVANSIEKTILIFGREMIPGRAVWK